MSDTNLFKNIENKARNDKYNFLKWLELTRLDHAPGPCFFILEPMSL
jgi:hypothetical protein